MTDKINYYLPHRYPFLLIDRVIEDKAGEYAICRKCVSHSEPVFQGHFPGQPIMPGVMLIEMLAQTAGIAIAIPANQGLVGILGEVTKAKFKGMVTPGDILTLTATIVAKKMKVYKVECVAKNEDKIVCQCQLKIVVVKDSDIK